MTLGGRNKLLCSASPAGSFVSEKVLTYSKKFVPKQCFFDQICQKTSKNGGFRPGTNFRGGNNISGRAVCIPNVRCRTQQFIPPPKSTETPSGLVHKTSMTVHHPNPPFPLRFWTVLWWTIPLRDLRNIFSDLHFEFDFFLTKFIDSQRVRDHATHKSWETQWGFHV